MSIDLTAPHSRSPHKRHLSLPDTNLDIDHPAKRLRRPYTHHHAFRFKQQSLPGTEPTLHARQTISTVDNSRDATGVSTSSNGVTVTAGPSQVEEYLDHTIILICEGVVADEIDSGSESVGQGLNVAGQEAIDTWALEIFRGCVEECM